LKFTINTRGIPSANKLYAAGHYRTRKEIADDWHEIVKYAVQEQLGDQKPSSFPIHIIMTVYPFNRKRDIGNTISKVLIDGLTRCGLIPNDSLDYVLAETVLFGDVDKDNPHIDVVLVELCSTWRDLFYCYCSLNQENLKEEGK
jgi:Holliday junction resolvase RusA-like endonuclease